MCDFPAKELLGLMRKAVTDAEASNDSAKLTYAAGYVKATCDLRLYHEDLTGCQCWYEALNTADNTPATHRRPLRWPSLLNSSPVGRIGKLLRCLASVRILL